jgi:hypothetical protein
LSRLPSSRGSSPSGPTRAAVPRRPGVLVQSPKSDIFVVLLGVSLGAIVLGCLLMTLLLARYGFSVKVSTAPSPAQVTRLA